MSQNVTWIVYLFRPLAGEESPDRGEGDGQEEVAQKINNPTAGTQPSGNRCQASTFKGERRRRLKEFNPKSTTSHIMGKHCKAASLPTTSVSSLLQALLTKTPESCQQGQLINHPIMNSSEANLAYHLVVNNLHSEKTSIKLR